MRIGTRLWLTTASTLAAAIAVAALVIVSNREITWERTQIENSQAALEALFRLRGRTFEYLQRPEVRSAAQWRVEYNEIGRRLQTLAAGNPNDAAVADSMQKDLELSGAIFDQLTVLGPSAEHTAGRDLLTDQLQLKIQAVASGVLRLEEEMRRRIAVFQRRATLAVTVIMALLVAFIGIGALLLARSTLRPLEALRKGTEIVGAGNLEYRIGLATQDELGELAAAFERMTERLQQATSEVRKVSAYSRSLIEASLDPLVTISAEGKITDVNDATVRATGAARDSLIGSDFSNYFTDPDKARAGYREAFEKGFVTDYPLTLRHMSGKTAEVLYNASVFRNEKGEVEGVFAAARDITARKRAETEMAERMKELQTLYRVSEMVERRGADVDSLYRDLVEALPEGWQYPEIACARIVMGEREYRSANFSVSPWVQSAPVQVMGRVVGKMEVAYLKQMPELDEGPFLNEERRLINAIAERVGHLAERVQAEEELRGSEERFRALADATSEGMLIHEQGRIVEANRQMEALLGRARSELIGANLLDFVAPASRDLVRQRVETPEDARVELVFERPDGSEVIASGLAHPCIYHGRPMRVAAYRDITPEKRAEKELRAASLYVRSLIEASFDPLVTISPEGKITDVNEATVRATGVPRASLIGTDFSNYFVEPDKARAGYQEAFAKGYVTDYPLALRHVSGRVTEVLYNASVYRNERGEVDGVFAAARDITERKRADQELRAASLYARSLIEASLDPLVTISAEGKITDVNEATIRATGVPRELLLGSDFSNYFTEPDKARAGYREVFENGYVTDYPLALRHVSGRVMEVLYNASIYRNEKGEAAGVFAAARDVTERKRAEDELRDLNRELERRVAERTAALAEVNDHLTRSTAFLEKLIEAIPEPMFYKDRQGIYRGGNEAFFKYLGLPRNAVIGKDVYGMSPKHLADIYKKADDELFEQGGIQAYESRVKYADGSEHDVIFHKATYPNPDGSIGGLIGTILDISERKEHERERERLLSELQQRADALAEANKELEGFSYSVAHDLRTPLRAIDGYATILLKNYPDRLDEEGQRYLNVVRDNTKKMAQLIDDMLAFARMGRLGMSISEVDMEALARAAFDELKPTVGARNLSVEIKAMPLCHGDAAMLRQVWMNLLSNAVKFTRGKEVALIEAGGRIEGAEHVYYVKDNGAGFDMQYVEKLFGVFQRLHGVEEFEGTGIGLAIVKRIITRHRGRVWAEGKVNQGATINFALPALEKAGRHGEAG